MEITVKLTGLDALTAAVSDLAKMMAPIPVDQEEPVAPEVPAQTPAPAPAPVPAPAPAAAPAPAPAATPAAAPAAAPAAVPVAEAKRYTLAELQRTCAPLLDAGKGAELVAVLAKYGAADLTKVPPEMYGALAADFRALGARL